MATSAELTVSSSTSTASLPTAPSLPLVPLLAVAVPAVLAAGCTLPLQKKKKSADNALPNTITSVVVRPVSAAATSVAVNGSAGTPGVGFALDGTTLPRDPGAGAGSQGYSFSVTATSAGGTSSGGVTMTINPAVSAVANAGGAAYKAARHLTERTGIGATADEIMRALGLGNAATVDRLLAEARTEGVQAPPAWINETILTYPEIKALSTDAQTLLDKTKGKRIEELQHWWLREIIVTSSPLTERMVLFWHNHFVTAIYDISEPAVTWRYLVTLRRYALGNFRDFLHAIAKDVAMVEFLDSSSNVKGKPNENFAREVMELFTLGEGRDYTELDVVELARAFTGFSESDRKEFLYKADKHDTGSKNIFGQTGNFDGDQALDLILAKPRCAEYIVEKLWAEFIGTTPDTAEVTRLAAIFRANYELKPLLRALFTSTFFTDPARQGMMLKAPMELFPAVYRQLGAPPDNFDSLNYYCSASGQNPLQPPNVKGWPGGLRWINAQTFLQRRTVLGWMAWELRDNVPANLADSLVALMLATDPVVAQPSTGSQFDKLKALFTDPAFHLK